MTCSEYFTGSDGSLPSETLFIRDWSYGPDPTIISNKLVFTSSSQKEFYGTYEFLGEFDYHFDFTLTTSSSDAYGWAYIGANLTISVFYDWYSDVDFDYFADTGDYVTTDKSGKLRLVRNASNDIYAYVWNSSLSRWEWNGDTSGLLVGNIVGSVIPYFGVQCFDDSILTIDDFIVVSGCDNTNPPMGDDDTTWSYGDAYRIYKTDTKGKIISTQWVDLSRGWATPMDELEDGWRPEDIDLNKDGEREVWGPGQPENYRR